MTSNFVFKRTINWNLWAPPVLFITVLIIEKEAFGTYYSSFLYGLLLIFFGIVYSVRYRLFQPAVIGVLTGLTLWHYILAAHYDDFIRMLSLTGWDRFPDSENNPFTMLIWMLNLAILFIAMPVFGPVTLKAFNLEQSARRIFRTAAQTVTFEGDGFTGRPFAAGNASLSKAQFTGLAHYLSGRQIVYPIFTPTGVFLTFSLGISPLAVKEAGKISYVFLEEKGNITVQISEKDYKRFQKKLSFDRLCTSLGDLFKRFLDYYASSQEARILSELKS